jgi:hypothetical protein
MPAGVEQHHLEYEIDRGRDDVMRRAFPISRRIFRGDIFFASDMGFPRRIVNRRIIVSNRPGRACGVWTRAGVAFLSPPNAGWFNQR